MGLEKILAADGVEAGEGFVGADGSLDFADFAGWAEDGGAVEDGGDLLGGEAVAFDGEGALDGGYCILFGEWGGGGEGGTIELADLLGRDSQVLLDFSGVASFNAASISALVQFNKNLQTKGSRIALCCLEPATRESFFVTG